MVPLFVQAAGKGSEDRAKTVAVNIAQDKLERIRTLDYDEIVADSATPASTPNLYNPSFSAGQFGPTVTTQVGSASKNFTVDYGVTEVKPTGSTTGVLAYKQVTVTVTWLGSGSAAGRRVVLRTNITRQDSGPQITNLAVTPLASDVDHEGSYIHTSASSATTVTLTATISAADRQRVGRVEFRINRVGGTGSYTSTVSYNAANSEHVNGVFTTTWTVAAGAPDGTYTFSAVAYTGSTLVGPTPAPTPSPSPTLGIVAGQPGNVWQLTFALDKGAPGTVIVSGVAGVGGASLSWAAPSDTDIDHYDVFRKEASSTTWPTDPYAAAGALSTFFIDRGVVAGTAYEYRVQVVDTFGLRSANSNVVALTPLVSSADKTAPTAPASLAATAQGPNVRLTWAAASDPSGAVGEPVTGVFAYQIYRDGSLLATVGPGQTSYNDVPGWSTSPRSYYLKAVDGALNTSAASAAVTATTGTAQNYSLTVRVYNANATVTVTYLDPDPDVSKGAKSIASNGTAIWLASVPMPYGSYRVTAVAYVGTVQVTKSQTTMLTNATTIDFVF